MAYFVSTYFKGEILMSTPTRDTAVSVSESTFLRDNMVCHLDTVTYVSAEHGEKETLRCARAQGLYPVLSGTRTRVAGLHFPGIRQRYRSACLARKPPRFHYTVTTYNYK